MPDGFDTGGFRAQQRFNEPATAPPPEQQRPAQPPPPEWTAATPPTGFPQPARPSGSRRHRRPSRNDLSTAALLRQTTAAAVGGLAQVAVSGLVQADQPRRKPQGRAPQQPVAQVNRPLQGCYRIALLSLKGGVGKTTITADAGRDVRVDPRRPRGRRRRQPRPRHAEPEGAAGDPGHRAASAARRRGHRALQRRPQLHVAGTQPAGGAGVGERPRGVGGVQLRRTTPARSTCSNASTAWCSPTAAPA